MIRQGGIAKDFARLASNLVLQASTVQLTQRFQHVPSNVPLCIESESEHAPARVLGAVSLMCTGKLTCHVIAQRLAES